MNGNTQQLPQVSSAAREKEIAFLPFGANEKDPHVKLSVAIVQKFLCAPTKQGHLCSERDAMKFIMICQSRKLNPWEGDCFLVGYDGKDGPQFSIITSHQAFLKRSEPNPDFDGMQSGVIVKTPSGRTEEHEGDFVDDEETLLGGWAKVFIKSRKYPVYRRLHIGCFKQDNKFWNGNPAGMITKCAEADALRSAFPTHCGGMYVQGEIPEPGTEAAFRAARPVNSDYPSANGNGTHSAPVDAPQAGTNGTTSEQPPARQNTPEASPQEKLKVFVEQEGFSWEVFLVWADGTGNIPENAEWKDFSDVPDDLAKRFLRAKDGLKKGLSGAKGVVTQ